MCGHRNNGDHFTDTTIWPQSHTSVKHFGRFTITEPDLRQTCNLAVVARNLFHHVSYSNRTWTQNMGHPTLLQCLLCPSWFPTCRCNTQVAVGGWQSESVRSDRNENSEDFSLTLRTLFVYLNNCNQKMHKHHAIGLHACSVQDYIGQKSCTQTTPPEICCMKTWKKVAQFLS